jgi:hypothetical protein
MARAVRIVGIVPARAVRPRRALTVAVLAVALGMAAACSREGDAAPAEAVDASAPEARAGAATGIAAAPRLVPDASMAAADELLARWRQGEAGTWRVDERFSRTRPDGEVLTWDLVLIRRPPDVLVVGGGMAHGVLDGRVVVCELEPVPSCSEPAQPVTFDPAVALDDALAPLGYVVEATGSREIAGEQADCYSLTARAGGGERRLGDHAELCLSVDGIPLHVVVERGGFVDRREAVTVSRDVTAADVTALLAGA